MILTSWGSVNLKNQTCPLITEPILQPTIINLKRKSFNQMSMTTVYVEKLTQPIKFKCLQHTKDCSMSHTGMRHFIHKRVILNFHSSLYHSSKKNWKCEQRKVITHNSKNISMKNSKQCIKIFQELHLPFIWFLKICQLSIFLPFCLKMRSVIEELADSMA